MVTASGRRTRRVRPAYPVAERLQCRNNRHLRTGTPSDGIQGGTAGFVSLCGSGLSYELEDNVK